MSDTLKRLAEAAETFQTLSTGLAPRQVATGSQRDSRAGKGRFDLIPPEPMRRLAGLYERGAEKYGDRNWEKGQPLSWYLDSMLRHANCFLAGDRVEDHIVAIAWNAFAYIATEERIKAGTLPAELNDIHG